MNEDNPELIEIKINDQPIKVIKNIPIIEACAEANIEIPRFCYHKKLKIAGNCRMCLVEVEGGPPKPVASCAMPVAEGMSIKTNSEMVQKAREGVMEFLLINHPLDCPICDQGGECDLQDQAIKYGKAISNFHEHKRAVPHKTMSPFIKTHMTRCIHCTRCVRFMEEIAGTYELGTINRGEKMEILAAVNNSITSELSGNIIDLCPVGALTSQPYAFKARPWELEHFPSIDVMDAMGNNIQIDCRKNEVMRILPRKNDDINEDWINDRIRFSYDGLNKQRIQSPYIRVEGKLKPVSWNEAYEYIVDNINQYKGSEIAGIIGNLADCESIYTLKKLMQQINCKNIECRNHLKINPDNKNTFINAININVVEEADCILLIGANPRLEASTLNLQIRKAALNGAKIFNIGQDVNLNYPYTDLGSNAKILQHILNETHEISAILNNATKPIIFIGQNVLKREDGELLLNLSMKIAQKFHCIQENWHGFGIIHDSASLTGAMLMHCTSNNNMQGIIEKINDNQIKLLFLLNADEIDMSKLGNAFVIYQGHHGDNGAYRANVILPGCTFNEKSSSYINIEGKLQQTARATLPPDNVKEDWHIINELMKHMKMNFFDNIEQIQEKMINEYKLQYPSIREWHKIDQEIDYAQLNIELPICNQHKNFNFYFNNPIARASNNMIKFVQYIKKSNY